jgi:hypothetical protein
MTTEAILHGYQIIIVPRLTNPAEVFIRRVACRDGECSKAEDLKLIIRQHRELLAVYLKAEEMLAAVSNETQTNQMPG